MDYKRPDGRLPTELRDIIISFDGLDGVDGSARFGFGETKALASVSGPMEVRLAIEQASRATFEVIVRPLFGLPGTNSKALASSLRNALQKSLILTNNPRTLVQLVALALSPAPPPPSRSGFDNLNPQETFKSRPFTRTGPVLVAALINASTLALLNASSIPLLGVVCSVAVGRVSSTGDLILDPSNVEFTELDGAGVFAFLITGDKSSSSLSPDLSASPTEQRLKAKCVWFDCSAAPFDEEELARAIELARAGALRVRECMKEAIERVFLGPTTKVRVKKEKEGAISLDDEKMEIS